MARGGQVGAAAFLGQTPELVRPRDGANRAGAMAGGLAPILSLRGSSSPMSDGLRHAGDGRSGGFARDPVGAGRASSTIVALAAHSVAGTLERCL